MLASARMHRARAVDVRLAIACASRRIIHRRQLERTRVIK